MAGENKKAPANASASNRQLPILPARLQASTFGLYVLNCCVRYGNRWNHIGIITGYSVERPQFSQNYTEETTLEHLRYRYRQRTSAFTAPHHAEHFTSQSLSLHAPG